MGTSLKTRLLTEEESSDNESVARQFPPFPLLSSSSTISSHDPLSRLGVVDSIKITAFEKGVKVKDEPRDDDRDSPDLTPPQATPDVKRKRTTTANSAGQTTDTKKQKREPKPKPLKNESTTRKQQPFHKIKTEPNEDDDSDAGYQGKASAGREQNNWTKEEMELVHKLCRQNKTGRQIYLELRDKLGSTKTLITVASCRQRVKVSQVEWSSEDVEHLLQAVKNYDKYKAIAVEFNKLSGRGEPGGGEVLGKGVVEFKLKSLEMEKKGPQKK